MLPFISPQNGFNINDKNNQPSKTSGLASSQSCNINSNCDIFAAFGSIKSAVFKINGYATGYMINNLANDGRLLAITKGHVFPSGVNAGDRTTLTLIFNYEFPACSNLTQEPAGITVTTSVKVLAKDNETDRVLFELQNPPGGFPANLDFQLLGWNFGSSLKLNDQVYIFGHPSGDVKKGTVLSISYFGDDVINANVTQGALESGSSGSPVLDAKGMVKGDVRGAQINGCGDSPEAIAVIDNFQEEWSGLKPFLDPAGTGLKLCGSKEVPLPVELISFTAHAEGDNVKLFWQTATEVNNSGFEIERKDANKPAWVISGNIPGWKQ